MRPTMRRIVRVALSLAAATALPAARAAAQAPVGVSVTVRAESTHEPVAGAQVEVMGTRRAATSGADGVARLRLPPGPVLIEVRKLGYGTERFSVDLPATDTLGIDVDLAVAPVRLDAVEARASATEVALRDAGFYERQRLGIGAFLTERDIARHPAARLMDAFRRVPGVRVVRFLPQMGRRLGNRSGMDLEEEYRISVARGRQNCWMDIYIDGVNTSAEELSQLPPREVIAAEVYRGPAEMPAQYRKTQNLCGAVVIWTRRGRAN
jgi:hypothetical protein